MLTRLLSRFLMVPAGVIGLLAVLIAWSGWLLAPPPLRALEWAPYDTWLKARAPLPPSPFLVLITADAETDALDHERLARLITALDRAGAAVIGIETPFSGPSPPGQGGAASDALLIEATKRSGRVVYPLAVRLAAGNPSSTPAPGLVHPAWPIIAPDQRGRLPEAIPTGPLPAMLAHYAQGLGQALTWVDEDGAIRRTPLYVRVGDHAVPSFALALATAFLQVAPEQISITWGQALLLPEARFPDGRQRRMSLPIDQQGRMLINAPVPDARDRFPSYARQAVWEVIERGDLQQLSDWVAGKVIILQGAPEAPSSTPRPFRAADLLQVQVLNTILTEEGISVTPPALAPLIALFLAIPAAWLLLTLRGGRGPLAVAILALGYLGLLLLALSQGRLMLPLWMPLTAVLVATGGAAGWMQRTAGRKIRLLEEEILTVQQALMTVRQAVARQESIVEGLEEDLAAARAADARSSDQQQELLGAASALRAQLAEAQTQEELTRRRLRELDLELQDLRGITRETERLGDAAQERLRRECAQLGILTRDPSLLDVFHDLKKAARSPLPVLILGEAGTGKELFARAVHHCSSRAGGPFVPVNMAAISPDLFESELFGHVKGSFTGAVADRKGYFEQAHGGTIFLDEIGDLRLEHQGKMLRVLQEKTFHRVGDPKPAVAAVRVVAATNKDLLRGVAEGWFREDLYFRLQGIVLRLPPLRDRPQDLALLAEQFVREAAAQLGRSAPAVSQEALTALQAHPWKGNIREFRHCLEQAVALAEGSVLTRQDLRLGACDRPVAAGAPRAEGDGTVLASLRQHQFDMQATASALGCDRSTVTQHLKGLGFRALVDSGGDQHKAALWLAGEAALARIVALKLAEYHRHLIRTIQSSRSPEDALAVCSKRFKNLPARHFQALEILVRQHFAQSIDSTPSSSSHNR